MKKFVAAPIVLILTIVTAFSLAACGSQTPEQTTSGQTTGTSSQAAETVDLGEHTAVYKGCTLAKTEDGRDAVVLTYDYTNGSNEAATFYWNFYYTAQQKDEVLEMAWVDKDGNDLSQNLYKEIAAGKTTEVKLALALENTEDNVNIKYTDLFEDHVYNQTIHLADAK